jgi:hypothetical protein
MGGLTMTEIQLLTDKPRELIVDSNNIIVEMERITLDGGRIWGIDTVPGRNAQWKLRIYWDY